MSTYIVDRSMSLLYDHSNHVHKYDQNVNGATSYKFEGMKVVKTSRDAILLSLAILMTRSLKVYCRNYGKAMCYTLHLDDGDHHIVDVHLLNHKDELYIWTDMHTTFFDLVRENPVNHSTCILQYT